MKRLTKFQAMRHEFDLRAKAYGLSVEQSDTGRWADPRAQIGWFFWYAAWQRRASWDKRRAARPATECRVDPEQKVSDDGGPTKADCIAKFRPFKERPQ